MKPAVKRKSLGTHFSLCVQPAFLIGTVNADGSWNFAPITWVSALCEKEDEYLLTVSMFGNKATKRNVQRTGLLSVILVSRDMLDLMDYFGTRHAGEGKKSSVICSVSRGRVLDVPVLDDSRWVYECQVEKTVRTGESDTFFCRIRNIQMDEALACRDLFDVDLTKLDPVIYSGKYHSIGQVLGDIGDFAKGIDQRET